MYAATLNFNLYLNKQVGCVFTNTDDKNFPVLLQFIRGEPLRMIRSISLTELVYGNGVNVSYIIRPMNVLYISTSFRFVQWKL